MKQIRFSDLPTSSQVNEADIFPIIQEEENKKAQKSSIDDYNDFKNKPRIKGNSLEGDLTLEDLGAQPPGKYLTEEKLLEKELVTKIDLGNKTNKNFGSENANKYLGVNEIGEVAPIDVTFSNDNKIIKKQEGNPVIITDSFDASIKNIEIYGQSEQDGTPSVENPIPIISKEVSEIKVTGKNLANIQEFEKVYEGKTFEALYEDDKITYSGANDWSGCGIALNQTFKKGQYTIQAKGVVMLLSDIALPSFVYNEYWNGKGYPYTYNLSQSNAKVSFNSDMPFKIAFIGGDINTGKSTVSGTMEQVQIELSSEATSYEPYKSQYITLSEPITLRGIPVDKGGNITIDGQQYVSDVITEKDGVIGVERNLNELLVSSLGGTKLYQGVHTNGQNYLSCSVDNTYGLTIPLSNRYRGTQFTMNDKCVYVPNAVSIIITDSRFTDKETAISIITEEQTKVVYVMNEPTFEPLPEDIQTQYKALKSYYPNTIINTNCWTSLNYEVSLQSFIEETYQKINEININNNKLLL